SFSGDKVLVDDGAVSVGGAALVTVDRPGWFWLHRVLPPIALYGAEATSITACGVKWKDDGGPLRVNDPCINSLSDSLSWGTVSEQVVLLCKYAVIYDDYGGDILPVDVAGSSLITLREATPDQLGPFEMHDDPAALCLYFPYTP